MTTQTIRTRNAFDRLLRDQTRITDIDRKLMDAFERLLEGEYTNSGGHLTVADICAEACVSRASYYRSPVAGAIKQILEDPAVPLPEIEEMRREVRELRLREQDLRGQHAAEVRELKDTIATYANQIQVLALRNYTLETENQSLLALLSKTDTKIAQLPKSTKGSGSEASERNAHTTGPEHGKDFGRPKSDHSG